METTTVTAPQTQTETFTRGFVAGTRTTIAAVYRGLLGETCPPGMNVPELVARVKAASLGDEPEAD